MPLTFSSHYSILAPPERVFAAITDMDGWKDWMHGLVRIEKLTDGGFREGTQWREVRKMYGKEAAEVFEVVACEPPRNLELVVDGAKGSSGCGEFRFTYTISPEGPHTQLAMTGVIDPGSNFFMKLMSKMFVGTCKKACDKDLLAMKAHLEKGAN